MKIDQDLWNEITQGDGSLDQRVKEAVAGVTQHREALIEARNEAVAVVAKIDREISRCNRILRAAEDQQPKKAPARKRDYRHGYRPKDESIDSVLAVLAARPDQSLTTKEIAEACGRSHETVRASLAVLREREKVRLVGKRASKQGLHPEIFRVMESAADNGSAA